MLILRELTELDEAAFMAGLKAYEGESLAWFTFVWKPGVPFADHLERLGKNKLGVELLEGRVPNTMLYAFVDSKIVGRVSIRHELNEYLRRRGGHIGYSVAPKFRRLGYATEIFKQSLPFCRAVGLTKIMITCDDENTPSWRLLETCGARLEEKFIDTEDGKLCRRYLMDT